MESSSYLDLVPFAPSNLISKAAWGPFPALHFAKTEKVQTRISHKMLIFFCSHFSDVLFWSIDDRHAPYNFSAPYIFFGELKFGLLKKKAIKSFAHQCPPARPCGIKLFWKNTLIITKRRVRTRTYSEVIQCSILLVDLLKGPKIPLQKSEKFCYKT